jgi:GMP synthase-like glutamine amidotransferase
MAANSNKPKKEPEVSEAEGKTEVQLMKSSLVKYPELYMNVYISEPDTYEAQMGAMFGRARCYKANTVDEADLVVFCGGADVDPVIYHEKPHALTSVDPARDKRDMELYVECLKKRIPMLGICRGAQFLAAMNGYKLIQHLDKHNGEHPMVPTPGNGQYLDKISSTHHQAVIQGEGMEVLGFIFCSDERWYGPEPSQKQTGRTKDVEAFFLPETCCLGFQGHPEYAGYIRYTVWCLEMVEKYILNNPHVYLEEQRYRHKRSVILGLPSPAKKGEKE